MLGCHAPTFEPARAVTGLDFAADGRCKGVRLASEELLEADAVVLAINHHTLPKVDSI